MRHGSQGPGIGSEYGSGTLGFLPDQKTIYFQSEESGYAHLYLYDLSSGSKTQLTSGEYEVYQPFLSKDGKKWYFTANIKHPGIRHFYSMPVMGGKITQITQKDGNNEVTLSPDEKRLAIRYSYIDQPWELYVQDNKEGAEANQLTESLKEGFQQYDWHQPDVITFKAEDGADVYARIYEPANSRWGCCHFCAWRRIPSKCTLLVEQLLQRVYVQQSTNGQGLYRT
jgi:dipeptidyl aminopeptidase/acylaminoacyl peptidase